MERLRVLHLEDNAYDAELVQAAIRASNWQCEVVRVDTKDGFVGALDQGPYDLIISDFRLPGFDGKTALSIARNRAPETPFIFVSGTLGEDAAIESLTSGATDYVLKDKFSRLIPAIQRAQREVRERTLRKRIQQELELTLTQLKNLFENLEDVFFSFDAVQKRFLQLSPACQRITGFTANAFFENPSLWKEFIDRADRTSIARLRRELQAGKASTCDVRIIRSGGSIHWVEARLKPVLGHNGALVRVDGLLIDVTERKHSEQKLLESEEKYRRLFEESKDAILVLSVDGRFVDINSAGVGLLGCASRTELVDTGLFLRFCVDPDEGTEFQQAISRQGYVRDYELRLKRRNGNVVTVLVTATTIRDPKGEVVGCRGIFRDVTEQRLLQAQVLRAQRLESIGTLASGISHDLNNILTPILMAVELLKAEIANPENKRILETLEISALRGRDLVRQVVTFARGTETQRKPVAIRDLILDVRTIMRQTFPKSVRIVTDVAENLWQVRGESTHIDQVLMNLCINARDAMPAGGLLTVSARNTILAEEDVRSKHCSPGRFVAIAVTDTGEGIPAELLDRVFEAFFTTKESGKGTGLGLSTVQAVVRNHGGFIDVESELGRGTRFTVFLPAVTSTAPKAEGSASPLPAGNGELILIVDDEAAIRDISRTILEAYGYRVLAASNGAEGLRLFQLHQDAVRLLLTDINMSGMGGPRMADEIRRSQPRLPIVFMTGAGPDAPGPKPKRNSTLLQKPFTASGLLQALSSKLRRKPKYSR